MTVRTFRPEDAEAIRGIMEASLGSDEIPGFEPSDIERSLSRVPADPEGCLVAEEDGLVVGYCIPRHDDLTIHPAHRRRGHGRRLVAAALALVERRGLPWLQLHTPVHLPASRAFAAAMGARYHSSLWLFELAPDVPVEPPALPAGYATRTYGPWLEVGRLVALMNDSFADHPTPLSWTERSIRLVHDLPDFDPDGVLLVAPAASPDDPVALCKVELSPAPDGELRGWVALIGVLPAWRGRGLGRELLRWGIGYLRQRGAGTIQLAAEALNERATAIYRRTGFVATIEWPHYVIEVPVSPREAVPAG